MVVPWIEPELEGRSTSIEEMFPEPVQERQALESLFGSGAWELDQPKVFECRQAKLLFKDYTKRSANTIELRPCTLIFIPEEELPVEDRYRRAMVMEVPEGAILEFDQPLDLAQGRMGRLVRGQLQGPVRIRSQGKLPGPEDDLLITTREVALTPKQITTSETVEFSWGPHFGRGQDLRIELGSEKNASTGLNLGGIRSIEVRQVSLVHLEVPAESTRTLPGNSSPPSKKEKSLPSGAVAQQTLRPHSTGLAPQSPSSDRESPASGPLGKVSSSAFSLETASAKPSSPNPDQQGAAEKAPAGAAEVTCRGPFRFDAKTLTASFGDQVQVRYMPPEGPTDSLKCDRLEVVFKPQWSTAPSKKDSSEGSSSSAPAAQLAEPKQTTPSSNPTTPSSKQKEASASKAASTISAKPNPNGSAPKEDSSLSRLEPQHFKATGRPVVLEAPSRKSRAVAERLEYHLTTGRTVLEGGQEVWICQETNEIHAQKLEYTPGPAGKLGQGAAEGPGWLRAEVDPRSGQTVQARWAQALQLRPLQGDQVLSLTGGAEVLYSGIGRLAAEQIHLWIKQQILSGPNTGKEILSPDRLLAEGQVRLQHPQVCAAVDRLEVWFETLTLGAAGQPIAPPSGPPLPTGSNNFGRVGRPQVVLVSYPPAPSPGNIQSGNPASEMSNSRSSRAFVAGVSESLVPGQPVAGPGPSAPNRSSPPNLPQQFEVQGKLLRVQILLAGQHTEVGELILEGDVYLTETQTSQPDQKPLVVVGDQIHVVDASRPYLALSVQGQPAHVEARGLGLNGSKINLHRGTNRLWIDGPGWMSLPLDRDLEGRPATRNEQIDIHWQQRMEFDGRSIRFEDSVLASSSCWQLRTDSLEVQLREPIVFTATKSAVHPELHRLICRSDVLLENRSSDARGEVSRDRVEVADLTVDMITGDLVASGPGMFCSVRRAQADQAEDSPGSKPRLDGLRPGASPTGLVFLGVEFQRSLVGNLKRREMTFADRVRTIYGPVETWEGKLQWGQLSTLPPQVVLLSCDQLAVAELAVTPAGERAMELLAVGNTVIESATYTARANRLSYAEKKGLVILEGDGRSDAELFSQERIGAPRQRVAARKIYYWPATNHLSIDNAAMLEVHRSEQNR